MDVVNFPAILAKYGLLKPNQVLTADDLILIGKKVSENRNGGQYDELAMTIADFLSMAAPTVDIVATDLYVDAAFGDDATAMPNRFDLPYKTITAALAVAPNPSTVHVRPGTYAEFSVKLQTGVKMFFEPGAVLNSTILTDNGADITTDVAGYVDLIGGSYLNFTGGSNITVQFNSANTTGTFLVCNPGVGKILKFNVSGNKVDTGAAFGFGATFRGNSSGILDIRDYFSAASQTLFFRSGAAGFSGKVTVKCPRIINTTGFWALCVNEQVTDNCEVNVYGNLINENGTLGDYNACAFIRRGKVTIYGNLDYTKDGGIPVIIDGGFGVGTGYLKIYGDILSATKTAVFASHRFVPLFVQGGYIQGGAGGLYGKAVVIIGASLSGLPGNADVWAYFKDCRITQLDVAAEIVNLTGNVNPSDYRIYGYNTEFLFDKPGFPDTIVAATPRTPGFTNSSSNAALGGGITDVFVPSGFTTVVGLKIPKF